MEIVDGILLDIRREGEWYIAELPDFATVVQGDSWEDMVLSAKEVVEILRSERRKS